MAIMPAIGEEIFMRGTVFPGLATRNIWFGVLMSGLFFSLMHANPVQTVHQFGLGVVLALVVALSGSIWASVIVHFVNNFISLTLTAYLPQVDAIYVKLGYFNWLTGAASVIIGIVLLVCLLYLFYRAGDKRQRAGEVSNVYEEDGFTIVATANVTTKAKTCSRVCSAFSNRCLRSRAGSAYNTSLKSATKLNISAKISICPACGLRLRLCAYTGFTPSS